MDLFRVARLSRVVVGVLMYVVAVVLTVGISVAGASGWALQSVAGLTFPEGQLNLVSCRSAHWFMALGSALYGSYIERWNGVSWAMKSVPDGGGTRLSDVSCSSSRVCAAVGWIGRRSDSTGATQSAAPAERSSPMRDSSHDFASSPSLAWAQTMVGRVNRNVG
jgi:hypothetical protein